MSTGPDDRTIEDALTIRMMLQRICAGGRKASLGCRDKRGMFQILFQEPDRIGVGMPLREQEAWAFGREESVSMVFEDRGFRFETVVTYLGPSEWEGLGCALLTLPKFLRRADDNRLATFAPDVAPAVTFSNSRAALLDGRVQGFGRDGLELALRDPSKKIEEFLRMGEESTLDLALEDGFLLTASARVAYFGANVVGMKFTERVDKTLLGQYRTWLENQERQQAQRDRESFEGGARPSAGRAGALPPARIWVDRDPLILVLCEGEDFPRRMGEALGRKFGVASLDHISGPVRPQLAPLGAADGTWGRVRMVLVHNQLRLTSPLALSRQLAEQERCELPIVLTGTDEDLDLKRVRALETGAVDYLPVEPFKILAVLRKLDELMTLFQG